MSLLYFLPQKERLGPINLPASFVPIIVTIHFALRRSEINLNKIFPNKFEAINMIEDEKIIPDEKSSAKKYFFTTKYPDLQEKKYVDEYLIVIATKNDVSFLEEYD